MSNNIADIIDIVTLTEMEKIKGYYDDTGLDMHIAVVGLTSNTTHVVVSTKHWGRVHYIKAEKTPEDCWNILFKIAERIGRTLIKSKKGRYVYVDKLNLDQTQSVFDIFKDEFGNDISRAWEISWDIENSVLPQEMQTFV